jgi:hypothetical protein
MMALLVAQGAAQTCGFCSVETGLCTVELGTLVMDGRRLSLESLCECLELSRAQFACEFI